jgi:hypothetical protein
MRVAIRTQGIGEWPEALHTIGHDLGPLQPAQTVGDLLGLRLPHRMILLPDALYHLLVSELGQGLINQALISAERACYALPSGHRCPFPVLSFKKKSPLRAAATLWRSAPPPPR